MLGRTSFSLMLSLALMLVHSSMAGILFLVVLKVIFLANPAVLGFSLLGSWSLGTMWLLLALMLSTAFLTVFFLWPLDFLWFSAVLKVRPDEMALTHMESSTESSICSPISVSSSRWVTTMTSSTAMLVPGAPRRPPGP